MLTTKWNTIHHTIKINRTPYHYKKTYSCDLLFFLLILIINTAIAAPSLTKKPSPAKEPYPIRPLVVFDQYHQIIAVNHGNDDTVNHPIINVWNRRSIVNNKKLEFGTVREPAISISITSDENYIISGFFRYLCLHKMGSEQPVKIWTHSGDKMGAISVAINPYGTIAASGHQNGDIRVYDINCNTLIHDPYRTVGRHDKAVVTSLAIPKNPAVEHLLVSGSSDKTAKIWDMNKQNSHRPVKTMKHNHAVTSVAVTSNGNLVVTGSGRKVTVWKREQEKPYKTFKHGAKVTSVAVHCELDDDRSIFIVSGSEDNTVKQWVLEQDGPYRTHTTNSPVNSVAISQDGKDVAFSTYANNIEVWSLPSETCCDVDESRLDDFVSNRNNDDTDTTAATLGTVVGY